MTNYKPGIFVPQGLIGFGNCVELFYSARIIIVIRVVFLAQLKQAISESEPPQTRRYLKVTSLTSEVQHQTVYCQLLPALISRLVADSETFRVS